MIQRMEVGDLDRIVDLERLCFSSPWSKDDFLYELNENPFGYYVVLKVENRILAYLGLWMDEERAQITTIGVDPAHRGKGYAKALMEHMLEVCSSRGVKMYSLEVRVSNRSAISLYKRFGFIQVGIRKAYYQDNHEDAYLMIKESEENECVSVQ
ncbi:MAG TPA: ribosomal-protein-alanine N-acetyltransferase [Erysipelotrichaceae bacterium]|nr:ribosomal-protein-alanine N-acetyltransferase [Erysipelotrichaceae bacterium]